MIDPSSSEQGQRLYLVRHGETEWSLTGQYTGRTDLALTSAGRLQADKLAAYFNGIQIDAALTSPLIRARQTCEAAGFSGVAEIDADLAEWNYGDYEGRTSADIRRERPDWDVFRDGCPSGDSITNISDRADRLIARLQARTGTIALFSHGQFGRVLVARWIGLPIWQARHLAFDPAAIGILGNDRHRPQIAVIRSWNNVPQ